MCINIFALYLGHYHQISRKELRVLGERIVKSIFSEASGKDFNEINIIRSDTGRPFIEGISNFDFNISHSREWLVCAVGAQRVAIDISYHRYVSNLVLEHYFNNGEKLHIYNENNEISLSMLHDLWALKECYAKYTGEGIVSPNKILYLNCDQVEIFKRGCIYYKNICFSKVDIVENYSLVVASTTNVVSHKILKLNNYKFG